MKDKGFDVFLITFFSAIGIAILAIVWTRQMPLSERLINTVIGSSGLLIALVRISILRLAGSQIYKGHAPSSGTELKSS